MRSRGKVLIATLSRWTSREGNEHRSGFLSEARLIGVRGEPNGEARQSGTSMCRSARSRKSEPPGSCPKPDAEHRREIAAILANARLNCCIGRSDR
jgi:hypothetical protein